MMNDHQIRSRIHEESKVHPRIQISLQTCKVEENESVIKGFIEKMINDERRKSNLKALLYILDLLLAEVPQLNGRVYTHSYLEFNLALDIFLSFSDHAGSPEHISIARKSKNIKKEFRNLLLHPTFGLCVYIVKQPFKRYIILRPDDIYIGSVLSVLTDKEEDVEQLEKRIVKDLLSSMDTEWDKKVLRYILSKLFSYRKYESLGMDKHDIKRNKIQVEDFLNEMDNIEAEASANVIDNLKKKRDRLSKQLSRCQSLLLEKRRKWTRKQIEEKEEESSAIETQRDNTINLIRDIECGENLLAFERRIEYEKKKLIQLKRMKLRQKGSGRKQLLDEEDEKYVAKSIEEKATAHGRRHDSTLYLGHRVKKKDFLKLINKYHAERGLPPVKSVTTVYNRGRAKAKHTIQARRHIGMGLWCSKKPPKSDSRGNLLTHFCRSTKKNVIRKLFSVYPEEVLCRSSDDKATVCPATGTGMNSTRNQTVFMPSEPEKQRMLPIYDWPTTMVNVTPGPTLYMTKKIADCDGTEKIITASQDVVCHIKPKFFVGSDATSWASLLMENRHNEVVLHEVGDTEIYSMQMRNFAVRIKDTVRAFNLQTIEEDVLAMDKFPNNPNFVKYEREKLIFLKRNCSDVPYDVEQEVNEANKEIIELLLKIVQIIDNILIELPTSAARVWEMEIELKKLCTLVYTELNMIDLPSLKRKVLDLTDAGPGVGISNHAVLYRVCAEILICKYDYYMRVHLAPGDSSNNEVERVQSSIGDAICDGGALIWDYFPKFSDVTDEEISNWTVQEHEIYEWERMEKNAFAVCEEVNSRVDGAATVDGYMKSYVSKHTDEFFFWDGKFLKEFIDNENKSQLNKTVSPGMNFYNFLLKFSQNHIRKGEKFLEYVKNSCAKVGETCELCLADPPLRDMQFIAQPYPKKGTYHYLHIDETPSEINGLPREVDDMNPRVQLTKLIEEGIDDKALDKIHEFCDKYIVEESQVLDHIRQTKNKLRLKAAKKSEKHLQKEADSKKCYNDYDWHQLIDSDQLRKQIVSTLDKYLHFHKLNHLNGLKKAQKVEGIKLHYYRNVYLQKKQKLGCGSKDDEIDDLADLMDDDSNDVNSDDDMGSDDDEVIQTTRTEPVQTEGDDQLVGDLLSDDDDNDANWEDHTAFRRSRYGRNVGVMNYNYL